MTTAPELPSAWHSDPEDSFHGKITEEGPFLPESGRYHLYIGLFCPFAHRVNLMRKLKQLDRHAQIDISVVKPYPKGNDKGWPGWQFNVEGEDCYADATVDKLFGSRFLHEIYFKADEKYKGRYSVPVLWDKKLNTIVNNESAELLRDLQTCFDTLLPEPIRQLNLYPQQARAEINRHEKWIQSDLNAGVYKTGFATTQEAYSANIPAVFAALNALEKLTSRNGGPYILGKDMTELDIRAYATVVRFDTVYHQHFKCNLGEIRHCYPVLNNWLKNLYWNHEAFQDTTNFKHIKENYTKSHHDINPRSITPLGPWPDVESGYQEDWSDLPPGEIDMPEVLAYANEHYRPYL